MEAGEEIDEVFSDVRDAARPSHSPDLRVSDWLCLESWAGAEEATGENGRLCLHLLWQYA